MTRELRRWFLAVLAVCGLAYALLTPPYQVPDEVNHFVRAYQTAHWLPTLREGRFIGVRVPGFFGQSTTAFEELKFHFERKASFRQWLDFWKKYPISEAPDHSTQFIEISNTILYSPVPYLPQIFALEVGHLFGARPLLLLYLARLATLAFYLLSAAAVLSLVRDSAKACLAFAIVFAFPMTLTLGASASADGPTIALGALATALCYRLAISFQEELFLLALAVLAGLSLCKPIYWPLALPLAGACYRGRENLRRVFLIAMCTFLPLLIWSRISHSRYVSPPTETFVADPNVQMQLILTHPFLVLKGILVSLWYQWPFLRKTWIGLLGWIDTPIPQWVRNGWFALFLFGSFFVPPMRARFELPRREIGLLWIAMTATVALLCLAIFLTWTPAGDYNMGVMQGRYFLPITFAWALAVPSIRLASESLWLYAARAAVVVCLVLELVSLHAMFFRFWA